MSDKVDKEYAREVLTHVLSSLDKENGAPEGLLGALRGTTGPIGSSIYTTLYFNKFYACGDDDDRWQAQRSVNLYIGVAIFVMGAGEAVLRWL